VDIIFERGKRKSVGRTKENDIVVDDTSVSKLHASIALSSDGKLVLADTGSTNGTFINGNRIAYGKAEPISSSDKLAFGSVEVELEHIQTLRAEPEPVTEAPTVAIGDFEFSSKRSDADGNDISATVESAPDINFTRSDAGTKK
jgi:pSer/pThr/pTyr-binding forkhead associated (FHA) protein